MEARAAKLALARKKLKDHQEKKSVFTQPDDNTEIQHYKEHKTVISTEDSSNNHTKIDPENDEAITKAEIKNCKNVEYKHEQTMDVNVTEILISNKRSLEMQISELQSKLFQLESNQTLAIKNNNILKQQIHNLEKELKNMQDKYFIASEDLKSKDEIIKELFTFKSTLSEDNTNLQEQLEFTKTILTSKQTENSCLQSQLSSLRTQLDSTQLQLQQVTSGSAVNELQESKNDQNAEILLQKIYSLEQQLKTKQKERDQINTHYEHYVNDLNTQLKSVVSKNEELGREIERLFDRESSLVDQISQMEITLQNYRIHQNSTHQQMPNNEDMYLLQKKYDDVEANLKELTNRYDELHKKYTESQVQINELSKVQESQCHHVSHEDISISKLNADITSDKVAAQRATEQNKKLKTDVQELEEAFVKISRDKLELTEKISAEKYLNRELTIKLAEIEEKAKELHTKVRAKDEEMIRLQTVNRELENKFAKLSDEMTPSVENQDLNTVNGHDCSEVNTDNVAECEHDHNYTVAIKDGVNNLRIQKEEAMLKLQDRFLKIMSEVADLADEKHRLEHIILQLQNETDTICEYVALYQQQRSLLNKRDEERSAQIKIFQVECDLLKNQIDELSGILLGFVEDKELASYFQVDSRKSDIERIKNLLSHLKSSSLIDPKRQITELKDFYPCSCCSGQLIDL